MRKAHFELRRNLEGLGALGLLRVKDLDDGRLRVAPPIGSEVRVVVEVDPDQGTWRVTHGIVAEMEGHLYVALCRVLGLSLEEAMRPVVALAPGRQETLL